MLNTDRQLLREHFPFESKFIQIAGKKLHYIDEGEGEVIILLHGNPTWSFYYRNLITFLSKTHRVIAPDFLGMGLSEKTPDQRYRAGERIEHLQEFIDLLNLEKFSLIMHDWGGAIGTGLAVRNVSRLNRIVYLNTTLTVTESLPPIIKISAKKFIGKLITQTSKMFLRFTTAKQWGVVNKLSKQIKRCYFMPYKTRESRKAIWQFVDDIPFDSNHPSYSAMLELASKISTLKDIPVQIIWGMQDPCFHEDMLHNVAVLFPQARVLEIPDASHLVLEDNFELASKTIQHFFDMPHDQSLKPFFSEGYESTPSQNVNSLYRSFEQTAEQSLYSFAVVEAGKIFDDLSYKQINYKELRKKINKYQRGFASLGLKSGDKVMMLVPPGVEFLALAYAVMGRGAVPVFLDPGMGKDKLFDCITELKPDVFIGSVKAHLLKIFKPKLFKDIKFSIVTAWFFPTAAYTTTFLNRFSVQSLPNAESDGTALIAYTSGATGRPKGVVYTNQMIDAQLDIFKDLFGLEQGKKDLPLLPIFSLFNLALGVTSVFPPMDTSKPLSLNPQLIVKIINDLSVDYSFGSPTLWKKISEYCLRSRQILPSVKKIFMAGAPVPQETLKLLQDIVISGSVYTPYGATEALPVTFISSEDILKTEFKTAANGEVGTLVGKLIPSVELKIIKPLPETELSIDQVQELPAYQIGEVIVKGKNISQEYFEMPDKTKVSKIKDGDGLWHRMGDLAYLDEQQNLYYCGRQAHSFEYAGKLYCSDPVENVINQHAKVNRSALIQLDNGVPAAVIELMPEYYRDENQEAISSELKELCAQSAVTADVQKFYYNQNFPVDARHNAKIFRDQLADWVNQRKEANGR